MTFELYLSLYVALLGGIGGAQLVRGVGDQARPALRRAGFVLVGVVGAGALPWAANPPTEGPWLSTYLGALALAAATAGLIAALRAEPSP